MMRGRDVAATVGVIALVILLLGSLGGGMMMGLGMMGSGMMAGYGMTSASWIVMVLFWVLFVAGVALLIVWLSRTAGTPGAPTSSARPSEILKERYARGEITLEQYEEMRRRIEGS